VDAWDKPEHVEAGRAPFMLPAARKQVATPPTGTTPEHRARPDEVEVPLEVCPDGCTELEHGHDALHDPAPPTSAPPGGDPHTLDPLSALVDELGRRQLPDGRCWLSVAVEAASQEAVELAAVLGGAKAAKAAGSSSPKERERATAARYRVWWTLYRAPGVDFRTIARVWGVNPTSVSDGVRIHQERIRREREAKGPGLAKTGPTAVRRTG
jgi:hypothetical protein